MSRLTDAVHVYISSRGMTEEEYLQSAVKRYWYDDVEIAIGEFYAKDPSVKVLSVAKDVLSLTPEEVEKLQTAMLEDAREILWGAPWRASASTLLVSALSMSAILVFLL